MRTAAEIFEDEFSDGELAKLSDTAKRFICDAINQARKEAIEECASKVRAYQDSNYDIPLSKDAILSLIDEMK